jgi:hypothetical protein
MVTMIHTYGLPEQREQPWPRNGLLRIAAKGFVYSTLAFFAVVFGILWIPGVLWITLHGTVTGGDVFGAVAGVGIWLFAVFTMLMGLYTECEEIRLGDDGTCEFETRRRIVRAQVAEIASVKERFDDEADAYWFQIRLRGRRSLTTYAMPDIEDFLTRIKAMNPAIDIKRRKS